LSSATTEPANHSPTQTFTTRTMQFALFFFGCVWLFASESIAPRAAQGIVNRLNFPVIESLLEQLILLFMLLVGFMALNWMVTRDGSIRSANALPRRATVKAEFSRGAAFGWAMLVIAIFPMMLAGTLHPALWLAPRSWALALLSLVTLAVAALALEVAFRGYLFKRLIEAIGPASATFFFSLFYAILSSFRPNATILSIAATFFTGILFSLAYLRTHGLWLGWGLHFAWNAAAGVLLGLPVAGYANYSSVVSTDTSGANWISGGPYGPEGALFTLVVVIAAIPIMYRLTREYSWAYTHEPIVSAGYAMDIAPPPAHTAMENAAAAAPVPLVQILGSTPTASSTMPVIDEHLRSQSENQPKG
jgi:membrane protease YdiL (CAAX protease family)